MQIVKKNSVIIRENAKKAACTLFGMNKIGVNLFCLYNAFFFMNLNTVL
ncbi:hypothetical protein HMPREF0476_1524 [Kingella kingae ATCC 23330]|uniref:Uncharacterized protein n=1 Tax=Kingella kingae ATCC 23330 TaxID=887327 RepID=F5S8J1_KINKI|nr:hypothetical protein HMPREF0476_1524 [Kingella kingae ATCC 23330]